MSESDLLIFIFLLRQSNHYLIQNNFLISYKFTKQMSENVSRGKFVLIMVLKVISESNQENEDPDVYQTNVRQGSG